MTRARRYITIIQAADGYPAPGEPREAAPPNGPAEPVLHSVVLADDYERLEAEVERLRSLGAEASPAPGPTPSRPSPMQGGTGR